MYVVILLNAPSSSQSMYLYSHQKLEFAPDFIGGEFQIQIIELNFVIYLNHSFRKLVSANFIIAFTMRHEIRIS